MSTHNLSKYDTDKDNAHVFDYFIKILSPSCTLGYYGKMFLVSDFMAKLLVSLSVFRNHGSCYFGKHSVNN